MRTSFLHIRSLLFSSLLVTALVIGCKSSDPDPVATTDLTGNYKVTAYTATDGKQTIDYVQLLGAFGSTCFQELVISFKSDGNITNNNPASCSSAADAASEFSGGKWAVNGTTLSLTPSNQPKSDWTYAVEGSKLMMTQTETISGTSVNTKVELTKQ